MKIAAAYVRVSDERQDEYSPDSQLKLIREYAKRNDYYIPDEYIFYDDGISAKTAQKRVQFNNMIALAKDNSHPFSAIFVWKFSRFARNQEESIVYKSLLKKNGVSVISVSEPVSEDNPFGTLIERIIEWMDEFYIIRLSEEVKRGMLEKASRGEPMCHPAYGYKLINKQYIPNAEEALIVKRIFSEYADGKAVVSIASDLGKAGVKTHRGNPPDNRWIEYIINNPVYIGKIRWSKDGRAASKRDYDNPNIITVDGKHEPIINIDMWNKAQEIYKERKAKYAKYQRTSHGKSPCSLRGLIKCSSCGSTLVYTPATKGLQCHKYTKGSCFESHYTNLKKAEEAVYKGLMQAAKAMSFPIAPKQTKTQTDNIDYRSLIASEELKLKRCKEAYKNGIDSLEEYKHNKEEITELINRFKEEETKARENDSMPYLPDDFAEKVVEAAEILHSDNCSAQEKNEVLRSVISHIEFNRKENKFNIYFS